MLGVHFGSKISCLVLSVVYSSHVFVGIDILNEYYFYTVCIHRKAGELDTVSLADQVRFFLHQQKPPVIAPIMNSDLDGEKRMLLEGERNTCEENTL